MNNRPSATPEGGGARELVCDALNNGCSPDRGLHWPTCDRLTTAIEAHDARRDTEYTERLRVAVEALGRLARCVCVRHGNECIALKVPPIQMCMTCIAKDALARLKEKPTT